MMVKNIFQTLLVIFYGGLVTMHCFFAKTSLHQKVSTSMIFAQAFAFETFLGCLMILFVFLDLWKKKHRYHKLSSKQWIIPLLYLGFSFCLIFKSQPSKLSTTTTQSSSSLKIVELNAENKLPQDAVVEIFQTFDADIAVLCEFGGYRKGEDPSIRLKQIFDQQGLDLSNYQVFVSDETAGNIAPVTVLMKHTLGDYHQKQLPSQTCFGTVYLQATNPNTPDILALHTCPPLFFMMDLWRDDLNKVVSLMNMKQNAIFLGDFNANLKHGPMSQITTHVDGVCANPFYKRGTWGLFLPKCLQSPIDHVFLPKDQYAVKDVEIKQFQGPDHRGIFLEVVKP